MHKESFFINRNTLLHISTLLGHLQGERFVTVTLGLHFIVEWECAVDCVLEAWTVCDPPDRRGFTPRDFFAFRKSSLADPQWPRGLRRRPAAEDMLGSRVRIPPRAWIFFSCTVFVLSGRGLCDWPIPHPEEFYRMWCVSECDQVKNQNPLHVLWTSR
jgi:hypothetical protein